MPISSKEFEEKGMVPKQRRVQEAIEKILASNPDKAFSSEELEELVQTRRESINQAIRALERKQKVIRGLIEQNKRRVMYVKIKPEGSQ